MTIKRLSSKPKAIRVRDLTDQTGLTGANGPRAFLYCAHCRGEYSAHAGDYFMCPPDHIMTCCGFPLRRVIARTILTEVA
jgi:hypothetical protein